MNDVLNRHDKMQRLNRSTTYIYPGKKNSAFAMLTLLAVGICIGLVLMVTLKACDRDVQPVAAMAECTGCHAPNLTSYKAYRKYHQAKAS